jgi:hypothetical protein
MEEALIQWQDDKKPLPQKEEIGKSLIAVRKHRPAWAGLKLVS